MNNKEHPKKELTARRKLSASLQTKLASVEQRSARARRMAVVTVGQTDFYDPAVVLGERIRELVEQETSVQPCRTVAPTGSEVSPAQQKKSVSIMSAVRMYQRMRKIRGGKKYIASWRAPREIGYGHFFLYDDGVFYQGFESDRGWVNLRVPEDGLTPRSASPL